MRAIRISAYGEADRLHAEDIEVPQPAEGEVLVRVEHAGVNFIDVYMRRGAYASNRAYPTTLPYTAGMEAAGRVERLGAGVRDLQEGDRVAYCLHRGAYAEFAVVPAWKLARVPEEVSLELGAAAMLQGCTAHYLTASLFPLESGNTCLIHAGAGGTGQILIQLAKMRGARVLTTVGSDEKAEIALSRGADRAIVYTREDFRDAVLDATGGSGVDVVYEAVGQATFEKSLYSLRRRGMCVLFGAASGAVGNINPAILADAGSVLLARPNLADYLADGNEVAWRAGEIFAAMAADRLDIAIDARFPLAEAAAAHRRLEERKTKGKVLLDVAEKDPLA